MPVPTRLAVDLFPSPGVDGHLRPSTPGVGPVVMRRHGCGAVAGGVLRATARPAANATMGVDGAGDAARRRSAARRGHGAACEPLQVGAKAWILLSRSSRWT